jgi:hypothetical protein
MTAHADHRTGQVLAHLAETPRGYDNDLKWNEVDKLKGNLMKARNR